MFDEILPPSFDASEGIAFFNKVDTKIALLVAFKTTSVIKLLLELTNSLIFSVGLLNAGKMLLGGKILESLSV